MTTMTQRAASAGTLLGSAHIARLHGAHANRIHRLCSLGAARRHAPTLRPRRVDLARRRLAAGCYDSDELLDTVLDLVIEDLSS
jgi:hypothetical protein